MNKELTKINVGLTDSIQKYLAQDLLKFNFFLPASYSYEIDSEEMVRDAEKNIKIATSEKTRILAETKEVKQFLDAQKAPVLEFEKAIEKQALDAKTFFDSAIQKYKIKKAEEQRKINDAINAIHSLKNKAIAAIVNFNNLANMQNSKLEAIVQKWEIESKEIPLEETETVVEILDTIEATIESEPVKVEIVEQEKNYVVERLIEDKEEYSIGNEAGFIKWCLENKKYELLDIKPKKSVFNAWVKMDGNKNHPFVKITVTKK